jgi:hypothetical protein
VTSFEITLYLVAGAGFHLPEIGAKIGKFICKTLGLAAKRAL